MRIPRRTYYLSNERSFAKEATIITSRKMAIRGHSRGPTYKVVLLGELGVGKTSLFRRVKDNTFDEYQTATTGIDSCTKVVKIDGQNVMLSIWDTAGVERFRTLTRNYYRNAQAAVFVYSVSETSTLHYLAQWVKDTQNFAPNAVRMLLGNKTDLEPEVDPSTAQGFADAHEFELNFQASCKDNTGIKEAFDKLAEALHSSQAAQGKRQDRTDVIRAEEPELPDDDYPQESGCKC